MSELPQYVLDRVFDAPRELVWRAWTEPDLITRWYGPNVETLVHKFEFKPGGEWLGEMKMGERSMKSKAVFQEIDPPNRLVWHESSADADWNIISNPMMQDWPKTIATQVTFADANAGAKTDLRLTWVPVDATPTELACFAGAIANMTGGWIGGFKLIEELLVELQSTS